MREIALSVWLGPALGAVHAATGTHDGAPLDERTPWFAASVTKLSATVVVMQLVAEGRLTLDERLVDVVAPERLRGLHVRRGRDRTDEITVRQLLAHTSGLPDYFEGRRRGGGRSRAETLFAGTDASWSVDDVIDDVRSGFTAHFAPGSGHRALYSDTNYQLLGAIIEQLTGETLATTLERRIVRRLGLERTWLCSDDDDDVDRPAPLPLRHGERTLQLPRTMASVRLDGGLVTCSADALTFVRAFFDGTLFPEGCLDEMRCWRRAFFPLEAGVGVLRFRLPRLLTGFRRTPALLGHSGISGAFAFREEGTGRCIAGTVNQLADRRLPYVLMLEALSALPTAS